MKHSKFNLNATRMKSILEWFFMHYSKRVVCSKDTDVLVLMAFVYALNKINENPAGMRCLWEISIRSPLRETSQRLSQKYLKRDDFFVTSLKRLKYISKIFLFCDVLKTSWAYLKKDVYSLTSLRRLKNISRKFLWFSKIAHKSDFVWFP